MAKYNGHPNWTLWNVSLWFANDEGLYRMAKDALLWTRTKDQAAARILQELTEAGITQTPDGAKYTKTSVRYALRDL